MKIASIHFPLNVSISRGSAKILPAILVKTLKHVRLRSQTSLGRKQKKTLLWLDAGVDNVLGVTRNLCYLSVLSLMKKATPWKMKMNLKEDFVSIGEPFSRHAKKARVTNTKIFCEMFNKLLMKSVGLLIRLSLMTPCIEERLGSYHFAESRTVFLSPRPLTSMTVEGLFDLLTHFAH